MSVVENTRGNNNNSNNKKNSIHGVHTIMVFFAGDRRGESDGKVKKKKSHVSTKLRGNGCDCGGVSLLPRAQAPATRTSDTTLSLLRPSPRDASPCQSQTQNVFFRLLFSRPVWFEKIRYVSAAACSRLFTRACANMQT